MNLLCRVCSVLSVMLAIASPTLGDKQTIVLRSGVGGTDPSRDSAVRVHLGPPILPYQGPIPAGEFAAARAGAPAHIPAELAPAWGTSMRTVRWITATPGGEVNGQTAIFAVPFHISPDPHTDRWIGSLNISFMADDTLGDATNVGIFVNEFPLAASTGGNPSTPSALSLGIPLGLMRPGENWIYFYVLNAGVTPIGGNPSGLIFSATLTARSLSVGPATPGGGGFQTISEALALAEDGDIIPVLPGVYAEWVRIINRSITLRATDGPSHTAIVGPDGTQPTLVATGGLVSNPTDVVGFTIRRPFGASPHLALALQQSVSFRDCVFEPPAECYGLTVEAPQGGNTACRAVNCVFKQRAAGAIHLINVRAVSTAVPARAEFHAVNCTLIGNGGEAPALLLDTVASGSPAGALALIDNSIVHNFGPFPVGMLSSGSTPAFSRHQALMRYTCIDSGYPGVGNIAANPLLANPAAGDYRLLDASPGIDAGRDDFAASLSDAAGLPRRSGARVDMGAHEFVAPSCPADFNQDGNVDPDDLGDFINIFFTGCP